MVLGHQQAQCWLEMTKLGKIIFQTFSWHWWFWTYFCQSEMTLFTKVQRNHMKSHGTLGANMWVVKEWICFGETIANGFDMIIKNSWILYTIIVHWFSHFTTPHTHTSSIENLSAIIFTMQFSAKNVSIFWHSFQSSLFITSKHLELHGCITRTMATDALVLKH